MVDLNSNQEFNIETLLTQKEKTKIQGLFEDSLFPPTERALKSFIKQLQIEENTDETRKVTWKRLSDILKSKQYNVIKYDEKTNPKTNFESDIITFNVKNHEFLSVLALFARNPKTLKETILKKTQINKNGYFDIELYLDGEPANFLIDDFFPVLESEISGEIDFYGFNLSNSNSIWPLLLAKVFVKFNYYLNQDTASDFVSSMEFFTPYPINSIENLKDNINILEESIKNALEVGFPVNAKINENEKANAYYKLIGLEIQNVYSIIDIQRIPILDPNQTDNGGKRKKDLILLKLNNPYASSTWNGDYSYDSPMWTDNLKENLDELTKTKNFYFEEKKGISNNSFKDHFWMSLDDFVNYFDYTLISMVNKDLSEHHFRITYDPKKKFNMIDVKIKKSQELYFSFNQMNPNFIDSANLKQHEYLNIFFLRKHPTDPTKYKIVKNIFSNSGRIFLSGDEKNKYELEQGEYLIAYNYPRKLRTPVNNLNENNKAEELDSIPNIDRDLVLGVFYKNASFVTVEPISDSNKAKFLSANNALEGFLFDSIQDFINDNKSQEIKQISSNYEDLQEKSSKKYTWLNDDKLGFGYVFYKNNSLGYLNESFIFNSLENVNALICFKKGLGKNVGEDNEDKHQISEKKLDEKISIILDDLINDSSYTVKPITNPSGKDDSTKYEVILKIAPECRALLYFEKLNDSGSINFESKSVFTYPPVTLYYADDYDYEFGQNSKTRNLQYEGKSIPISQNVLEYGAGVQYLYKNNTKNKEAKVIFRIKNSKNIIKIFDSPQFFELMKNRKENEIMRKSEKNFKQKANSEEKIENNLEEIIIECRPNGVAFLYLEAKNPFEGFSYDLEVEYQIRTVYEFE